MNIIFFGTPDFAANNLQHLIDKGYKVVAIVAAPDSRKGRGKELKECAVKKAGILNNIPVLQPLKLKDNKFITDLNSFNADLFVVVAFRMLPDIVWRIPSKGTINLHTSLLPNYRGAAPINWVLINGEKETGVTTFFIDNNIDSGDIILQNRIEISNTTTAGQLHNLLMNKGKILLEDTLRLINDSKIKSIKQKTISEIILATNATVEGQITAQYIADNCPKKDIIITRLAQGIPIGGELETLDYNTLSTAFSSRTELK